MRTYPWRAGLLDAPINTTGVSPVDRITIDRVVVDDATQCPDAALVEAIVHLADTFAGIERRDQFGRLRDLGCRLSRGYDFTQPRDADTVGTQTRDADTAGAQPPDAVGALLVGQPIPLAYGAMA